MRQNIIAIIGGFFLAGLANAAPVVEAEVTGTATNNTTASAQALPEASFTTPVPPTVFDPPGWPTATVSGKGGGNDVDFYSFSTAGGGALFDIDTDPLASFDTILSLFSGAGTLIAWDDDSDPADSGSEASDGFDSFIGTIILPAGNYFIAVSDFPNEAQALSSITAQDALTRPDGQFGGWLVSGATPGNSSFTSSGNDMNLPYTLHVSLQSPGVIPEPETYALLLAGLGLLGFVARRRRKRLPMKRPLGLTNPFCTGTAGAILLCAGSAFGATPINLSTWSEQGNPSNGTWTVAAGGSSVFQSINGNPTFFVSPNNFINTEFNGTFKVETTGDDDYIGFVFGYQSPLASNGDAVNDYSFFLFDWKQANQGDALGTATEGFNLSYVNGVVTTFSPFWAHGSATSPDPDFQVIDTDYGATRGWADNTEYEFTLLYQSNRIKIDVKGGSGDFATGQTIFDIDPTDVSGLSEFPNGRFGFYNYSQASVRYQGFTEDAAPPIPEPETYALLLAGLGLLGFAARRRRAA